jgi:ribosomal protein S18 acetylase RimI-like enzyme
MGTTTREPVCSMTTFDGPFRRATLADAAELAELVEFASEGLALCLWTQLAGRDGDPWEVGRSRVSGEAGGISYRNALIAELSGNTAGTVIGYPLGHKAEPIEPALPGLLVPLHELMNMAPDTWYVHALAAYPEHRGGGLGTALLAQAGKLAADAAKPGLSLIVSDTNTGARRLYERNGFREVARRRMVKQDWQHPGTYWVLMRKQAADN